MAIMRYCNNGNDKYFANRTAKIWMSVRKCFLQHTYHYRPLNKFAPTLPVIHEVDCELRTTKKMNDLVLSAIMFEALRRNEVSLSGMQRTAFSEFKI